MMKERAGQDSGSCYASLLCTATRRVAITVRLLRHVPARNGLSAGQDQFSGCYAVSWEREIATESATKGISKEVMDEFSSRSGATVLTQCCVTACANTRRRRDASRISVCSTRCARTSSCAARLACARAVASSENFSMRAVSRPGLAAGKSVSARAPGVPTGLWPSGPLELGR